MLQRAKNGVALLVLALLFAGGLAVGTFAAGGYSLDWWTVDGGGGVSSGGSYALSGTVGQPDAGPLAGGSFTLAGGFWAGASANYQVRLPMTRR